MKIKNIILSVFLLSVVYCLKSEVCVAALRNGIEADIVIGQPDFTNNSFATAQNRLRGPQAVSFDGKRLFVPDTDNNRVLIWNKLSNSPADIVLGQPNFTAALTNFNGVRTARTMSLPDYVLSDGQRLFVNDRGNHRVLIWNSIPASNYAPADVVVGQPDFSQGTANNDGGARTARTLSTPTGVSTDGQHLFIADTLNNRVLIWNSIPQSNFTPADVVLGQSDFTTATINNGGRSARSLFRPTFASTDGRRFFVSDNFNARVLIWNEIPKTNFSPADVVVGQPDFTTDSGGDRFNSLSEPRRHFSDGRSLFVAASSGHRILIWKEIPSRNGQPADIVLGQPDFSTTMANIAGVSNKTFSFPDGINPTGRQLIVADRGNNRILVFNISSISTDISDPQFTQGKAVLGKVFEDKNSNGRQDNDEKGIEGVKIASDTGIYAVTDEEGKYHFPFIQIGQRVLKINESTLPEGSVITTESPRKVVVTKGILTKTSFGVKLPEGKSVSEVKPEDDPLLKVSLSQDAAALQPRLSVAARQEDDKVIFTIDCNYFLFVERAELKLFDTEHKLFKIIGLKRPLPYDYKMPAAEFIANKLDEPKLFYYQLSVFNARGSEDRTNLGEMIVA
jgi:hypothetical protein